MVQKERCFICDCPAKFCIKGTKLCYCEDHAREYFADITYLTKLGKEIKAVRDLVEKHDKE